MVVYRSPSQTQSEFIYLQYIELMLSKIHEENSFCVITTGDFNCCSTAWWENDIENNEGRLFELFASELGLHQLISEPTHLLGDSKSCIDLTFTDQPNLYIETGVHPSLHSHCHHQIVYGKLSIWKISQPPYSRRIWHYDKADASAIIKSIELFNRNQHPNSIHNPEELVKLLTEVLFNIYSNFIPNEIKTARPHQGPCLTQPIKNFPRNKNRVYKNFIRGHSQRTSGKNVNF